MNPVGISIYCQLKSRNQWKAEHEKGEEERVAENKIPHARFPIGDN